LLTTLLTMSTSVLTTMRISSRCLLALTEILVVSLVATHVSLLIVVVPHSVVSHLFFPLRCSIVDTCFETINTRASRRIGFMAKCGERKSCQTIRQEMKSYTRMLLFPH